MTTATRPAPSPAARPAARSPRPDPGHRSAIVLRWVFLAPTMLGIGLFVVLPILASLVLAFFRWDIITAPEFVGLRNFLDIAADETVRISFLNTTVFVIVAVSAQLAVAMLLAVLVQSRMPSWLRVFLRSTFFFPLVLSAASVSILMRYLFNESYGVINWLLSLVSIPAVPWLTSPQWAMVVVIAVYVWQNFGFSFLLFIGGLAAIPRDVYEASSIDGATGWRQFRNITLPLVSPTILVASVMAIISALQVFDQPYVLTRGGPGDATRTVVMVIYESAFRELEFGRASAIGLVLMVLIMLVTAAQFRLAKSFVFYQ
ncbi:carbohydrate ABC transporter permease [Brachybacterium phenoliresistens]|uniref:Sugar ABC transporter permease n=1 Tax=Brachybacterium phenoliresistens TaxID=396014 RepID=Z9JPA9_9MICO|nr:sugar ABC transporter permease [Brachybacterium phenoliresistens]